MLISNKSITDLKVLSRTEAHTVFRNLKCATSRVQGWGTQWDTWKCTGVKRPKVPQSKRYGSSVDILFSCPHRPCIPASRLNLQGKSCLSPGESVLECFNGLGHHRSNFLHSWFPGIIGKLVSWDHAGHRVRAVIRGCLCEVGSLLSPSHGFWGWN